MRHALSVSEIACISRCSVALSPTGTATTRALKGNPVKLPVLPAPREGARPPPAPFEAAAAAALVGAVAPSVGAAGGAAPPAGAASRTIEYRGKEGTRPAGAGAASTSSLSAAAPRYAKSSSAVELPAREGCEPSDAARATSELAPPPPPSASCSSSSLLPPPPRRRGEACASSASLSLTSLWVPLPAGSSWRGLSSSSTSDACPASAMCTRRASRASQHARVG